MKVVSFEEIKAVSQIAYDFLVNTDLRNVELGRHYFDYGIYANVETYESKPRHQYESHRKYIDIQVLISGTEKIIVDEINNAELKIPYDAEKDITFYYDNNQGKEYLLKENDCLVLYPEDIHMPCVMVNEPTEVKKIVFKIPYSVVKNIKVLAMDVDGTLTDGKIYMGNDGEEFKAFSIKDGGAIANLIKKGKTTPVIITGRTSKIVENRAKELGVRYLYQGVSDKTRQLKDIVEYLGVDLSNVAYIGDDDNDMDCMELVKNAQGLIGCPRNSSKEVTCIADYVSSLDGGTGAVKDFINWLCLNQYYK